VSLEAAIQVRELRVVRGGRPVLHSVSLEVHPGSVTGLLGPSGCGKTTLMRSIVGAQIVQSGSVTVFGVPAGSPELRPAVGYVTQAPSVYGDLTVDENLAYFASIFGVDRDRIDETLETVSLGTPAGGLHSGGVTSRNRRRRTRQGLPRADRAQRSSGK